MNKTDNPWQVYRRRILHSLTQSLDEIAEKDERESITRLLSNLTGVVDTSVITKGQTAALHLFVPPSRDMDSGIRRNDGLKILPMRKYLIE